jgi:NAD(P)-dependent dehydrogenase (short-subunit alcohol dehydrogenase family)
MNIDLSGLTALVTGSTTGIGRAIATGLARTGAEVVVTGRVQANVDKAMASISQAIPAARLRGIAADLSTADGCARLPAAIPDVDILVNNAGIFSLKDFFDTTDDDWEAFFAANLMSGVRLSRAYLKGMLQRNWGRIVFISSESALNIPPDMIHYGVTKTAQLGVSRGLAELTAGTGVTVNAVLPGPTLSEGAEEFVASIAKQTGQTAEQAAAAVIKENRPTSLLQRFATVDEVANMVVYVCSKQASATNGAALRVDGGVVRTIA